jgi:hypothetical protein
VQRLMKSHTHAFCKTADARSAGVVNPSLDSHAL